MWLLSFVVDQSGNQKHRWTKLQNTRPSISISLNNKSFYSYLVSSAKALLSEDASIDQTYATFLMEMTFYYCFVVVVVFFFLYKFDIVKRHSFFDISAIQVPLLSSLQMH